MHPKSARLRQQQARREAAALEAQLNAATREAVDAYLPSKHEKEKAGKSKRTLAEMIQEQGEADPRNVQPIPFDDEYDILKSIFGERRGTTVRGVGGTVKRAAKRRGGPQTVFTQEDDVTLEDEERIQELEERARQAEERVQQAVERVRQAVERAQQAKEAASQVEEQVKKSLEGNQILKERIQAMEALLQNLMAAQVGT